MMTKDKAETKWCPFQRQSEQGCGGSYNRPSDGGFGCITSECMAWRWYESPLFQTNAEEEFRRTGKRLSPTEGYCGLAGKPQCS